MNTEFGYIPIGTNLLIYYVLVSVIGFFFFIKLNKDRFSIIIFMIFFSGVFTFWSELIDNLFKILVMVITIFLYLDTKKTSYLDIKIIYIFLLFSIAFGITIYINQDPIIYSLSQYSKFLIPFLVSIYIVNNIITSQSNLYYLNLVIKLLMLQVLFSVIKLLTIGFSEPVVGSVTYMGGNPATFLPILGLLIIYTINNGNIKFKDIIMLSSMLIISIMSFKRIIWFIYPVVLMVLNMLSGRTKYIKYIFFLAPLVFYIGVRLNPTLNKEQKIWGSFDFSYVIEYSEEYSGIKSSTSQNVPTSGRIAGNYQMIKYVGKEINNYKTWVGYGPKSIYGISYDVYEKGGWKWEVNDKGSLTGAARFLISYGLIGMILYVGLIIFFFYKIDNKKFRLFIIGFFLLEFFFYLDTLILPFLMIPLLLLSNYLSLYNINNSLIKLNIYRNELNST